MTTQAWYESLAEPVRRVFDRIILFLPDVIGAVALLLIGWVLARLLRAAGRRLAIYGLKRLGRTASFETGLEKEARYRRLPDAVGWLVFWIVLLFFIAAAIEALGLPAVSDLLAGTSTYLPRVLAATVIVFAGILLGDLVHRTTTRAAGRGGIAFPETLGRGAQVICLVLAVLIAIDQLGIESTVLLVTLSIALGSAFAATALAFGLGAGPTVSNIIAAHYVQKAYRVGNKVRVDELEGTIAEISRTAVVLDTPRGRAQVPARRFSEEVSMLVKTDG